MKRIKEHTREESWMTTQEQIKWQECVRAIRIWLRKRRVPQSPLVLWRVRELALMILLGQRLEQMLYPDPGNTQEDSQNSKKNGHSQSPSPGTTVETIVKHWERTRKAMNELEDYCQSCGSPAGLGLADVVKPIIKKGYGVLEESLEPPPAA